MIKKSYVLLLFLPVLVAFAAFAPAAYAALERVGPVGFGGYPAWYQDKTGLALEFCSPLNDAELAGGYCLLLTGDTVAPEVFPGQFADEHFYWAADALLDVPLNGNQTTIARLVLGLEGAFAVGPVISGDQIVFGRIRVDIRELPASGTYTIYHPFGVWTFSNQVAGSRLFFTEDIGIQCPPGQFDCALASNLGPFLLASDIPGGIELPAVTGPVPGKLYVADPARLGPVTGSPLPDFVGSDGLPHNHNVFRIEGPNGLVVETNNFTLVGRLMTAGIPGKVTVDRASYAAVATGNKLDVFATAFAATQTRLPGQSTPPKIDPVLVYYDAPCVVDPITGALTEPANPPAVRVPMFNTGSNYWGQNQPLLIPIGVCVEDYTAKDANGQVVPTFFNATVTDQVFITEAIYDPSNGGSLSVKATSSDEVSLPPLSLVGFPTFPYTGVGFLVTPLAAPPASIRVLSAAGGLNQFQVSTLLGTVGTGNVPVANNDETTVLEDSVTTAINVLANDLVNGVPIVFDPLTVIVTITGAPRLGTAVANPTTGTIDYTPALNASGIEGIGYTVSVNGLVSPQAYLTINITPVNDAPVAVNDTISAVANVASSFNVVANDTDVDGDILSAINVIPSAGLTINSVAGGVINFTAAAGGTYTFTYQAQDPSLAVSNTATATVNVIAGETITVGKARFEIAKVRWQVSGSDSVPANQTLTIAYANGSIPGFVIGTAVVDAATNWALDLLNVTGPLDPRNSGATQLRITSPLGGTATATIEIK